MNVQGDILANVNEVPSWISYVLRAIFIIVISTHTPFIFFLGKEGMLVILAQILVINDDIVRDSFRMDVNNLSLETVHQR